MKFLKVFLFCLFIFEESFGIKIIRDAEIETVLTEMVKPIFKVAGLKEKSAKIFVIDSDEVNAFTIGSGCIFINSGLLLKFKDPVQVIAVLSHETAHIAARHIARLIVGIQNRQRNAIGAIFAGLLATILTRSEKAMAATFGYLMADEALFLRYSREQELAADSLGASYMEKLGYDPEYMIQVLQSFEDEHILNGGEHTKEYTKTHPHANSRITALQNRSHNLAKKADKSSKKKDKSLEEKYSRILRKLKAHLKSENSSKDDYSRAIYLQRCGRISEAIAIMEELSRKNPRDIFYKEALAHLLYESGNLKKSIKVYEQIYEKDLNPLIKKDYAEVLIEANHNLKKAIRILESIEYDLYFDSEIFRLLAKAYGKKKKIGIAKFMLAREQLLKGNLLVARQLLDECLPKLNKKKESSYIRKAKYLKELINRNQR